MVSFFKPLKLILVSVIIFSLFSTFIYTASPPPPPPPPCTTQSSGCYKKVDLKVGFNELNPSEFDYFLPDDRCVSNGTCDCGGVPSTIVEERDPDDSSGACACIAGSDYNPNGRCCGDDAEDCGRIDQGVLCSIDANAQAANWIPSEPNLGDIRYVGCIGLEYLSEGSIWTQCSAPPIWKKTVSGNEYMCINKGRESIAECCGDGTCNSKIDGKRLSTGQSIVVDEPQPNSPPAQPPNSPPAQPPGGSNVWTTVNPTAVPEFKESGSYPRTFTCPTDALFTQITEREKNEGDWWDYITGGECSKNSIFSYGDVSQTTITEYGFEEGNPHYSRDISCPADTFFTQITELVDQDGDEWGKISGGECHTIKTSTGQAKWGAVVKPTKTDGPKDGNSRYTRTLSCPAGTFFTKITEFGRQQGDTWWFIHDGECRAPEGGSPPSGIPTITLSSYKFPQGTPLVFKLTNGDPNSMITITCLSSPDNCPNPPNVEGPTDANGNFEKTYDTTNWLIGAHSFQVTVNGVNVNPNPLNFEVTNGSTNETTPSETTYYCTPEATFVTDLDDPQYESTCIAAGFTWTGTKCCSEADDPNEYYNDPGGIGGCWDSEPVISVDFVNGTEESVGNYNGEFHGCAIDKTNYNTENDNLLSLTDLHTGGTLITNHDYCFTDPEQNYFCSFTEKWLLTDGINRAHLSYSPLSDAPQKAECCPENECWDGSSCIASQRDDPLAQPIGDAPKRCIDGEWADAIEKCTADGATCAYCTKTTQCLANAFGTNETTQCFDSGQFIGDNYCADGKWSSRTNLLALELLKLKGADYSLFCDNKENTLNYLQYITASGELASTALTNLKTNNFCVLKSGAQVVVGTTVNQDIEDIEEDDLSVFGISSCDGALSFNDGKYHPCDPTNKVWANKNTLSVIYSATPLSIPSGSSGSFEELIKNPITDVAASIKSLTPNPPFDDSYVNAFNKLDRIYFAQQAKSITGAIEGSSFKNVVVKYSGFDTDICKYVNEFNQTSNTQLSGITCKKESNNYYVLAQGSQFTNLNPDSIWPDLAAKLRLK